MVKLQGTARDIIVKSNLKLGNEFNDSEIAIEVDGGVAPGEIAENLKARGANVLVAGSAIYKSANIDQTIEDLKTFTGVSDI